MTYTLTEKLDHIADHFWDTGDQHDYKVIQDAMKKINRLEKQVARLKTLQPVKT